MLYSLNIENQTVEPYEIKSPLNRLGALRAPVKRVNIQLVGDSSVDPHLLDSIRVLEEKGYEYTCCCSSIRLLKELLNMELNAYVNWPITDWETATELINLGVSDILIDGPLGFDNDNLRNRKGNVRVRAVPNYSSIAAVSGKLEPRSFYIRPEDTVYYTGIDILEFRATTKEQEKTLFDIYTRGSYLLNLRDLVPELSVGVANPVLLAEEFTEYRLNCGQRCTKTNKCNICSRYFTFINDVEKWMNSDN